MSLDTFKTRGLRRRMLEELRMMGITSESVLNAISSIPRHIFLDSIFERDAYEIKAFPIKSGQTISSPYTVAYQSEWLELTKAHKVLEIGTGSGYQCAVLAALGVEVFSIEYVEDLHNFAFDMLQKLNLPAHLFHGDGSKGLPDYAPYDRIIVTAGAPSTPQTLIDQLSIGGILVIPVGNRKEQMMMKYRKLSPNKIIEEASKPFKFVPLKGQFGWD